MTGTAWFSVGEGDDALLQADDTPVRDGDFEDVGREVFEGSGAIGSSLAVHVPGDVPDLGIDLFKLPAVRISCLKRARKIGDRARTGT